MNIAEISIRKNIITLVVTVLMVVGGIYSYNNLSRLEDPEFTIKDAVIYTPYPGASASEVEKEVADVIEQAVQQLGQLRRVESTSMRGVSIVKVTILDKYDSQALPQIWDELRNKVTDHKGELPPGAGPPMVNDDYGDVYGLYYALTGEGYSYAELRDTAKMLRRELLLAEDVKKIAFYGERREAVYVEMSRAKMAELGISPDDIYRTLMDKNIVISAGYINLGQEYIPIAPEGEFFSVEQFEEMLISPRGSDRLIYLGDVASVRRDYVEPASNMLFFDDKPAIGIGISTVSGGNVVTMGKAVHEMLEQLKPQIPLGMEMKPMYMQSEAVELAVNSFIINLIQAIIIVVLILLVFMGIRSGLIIGAVLLITICGTFIVMEAQGIILQRVSLGALIIALGMLVDNAIVITDGMRVRIDRGMDSIKAASEVVGQTALPLLGATAVAVLAFAAIGTSQDSSGEFCRSLYQVILIALSLSWLTAVTVTPLFCKMFLKGKARPDGEKNSGDSYSGAIYQKYKRFLSASIRFRKLTVIAVVFLFLTSLFGFRYVKNIFFPDSTTPLFIANVWFPEGTHIDVTSKKLAKGVDYLKNLDGVKHVATTVGGGNLRFMLTYSPEYQSSSYGQYIIMVDDYRKIGRLLQEAENSLNSLLPEAMVGAKKIAMGPGSGGKIQFRISGPDHSVLRELAGRAKDVLHEDGGAKTIRDEWGNQVKVVRPQFSEAQAMRSGITRSQLANALKESFSGIQTGIYREGDDLLPIFARASEADRLNVDSMKDIYIWSAALNRAVPISNVVSDFPTEYEDVNIWRRNRMPMIRVHCDPDGELADTLLARVRPQIEEALGAAPSAGRDSGMPLKNLPGYKFEWGGELESSTDASEALTKNLPKFGILMVLIVIVLFNSFKQPAIIWLCVPLAMIGITAGLLITDQPFSFMALLGLLSLSGMLIKNGVVLIDEIDTQISSGKERYASVIDSGISRLIPVSMASLTTILGMTPLIFDAFFVSMAVTIMFGLGFATVLTLIFVPVLYTIFLKIPSPEKSATKAKD